MKIRPIILFISLLVAIIIIQTLIYKYQKQGVLYQVNCIDTSGNILPEEQCGNICVDSNNNPLPWEYCNSGNQICVDRSGNILPATECDKKFTIPEGCEASLVSNEEPYCPVDYTYSEYLNIGVKCCYKNRVRTDVSFSDIGIDLPPEQSGPSENCNDSIYDKYQCFLNDNPMFANIYIGLSIVSGILWNYGSSKIGKRIVGDSKWNIDNLYQKQKIAYDKKLKGNSIDLLKQTEVGRQKLILDSEKSKLITTFTNDIIKLKEIELKETLIANYISDITASTKARMMEDIKNMSSDLFKNITDDLGNINKLSQQQAVQNLVNDTIQKNMKNNLITLSNEIKTNIKSKILDTVSIQYIDLLNTSYTLKSNHIINAYDNAITAATNVNINRNLLQNLDNMTQNMYDNMVDNILVNIDDDIVNNVNKLTNNIYDDINKYINFNDSNYKQVLGDVFKERLKIEVDLNIKTTFKNSIISEVNEFAKNILDNANIKYTKDIVDFERSMYMVNQNIQNKANSLDFAYKENKLLIASNDVSNLIDNYKMRINTENKIIRSIYDNALNKIKLNKLNDLSINEKFLLETIGVKERPKVDITDYFGDTARNVDVVDFMRTYNDIDRTLKILGTNNGISLLKQKALKFALAYMPKVVAYCKADFKKFMLNHPILLDKSYIYAINELGDYAIKKWNGPMGAYKAKAAIQKITLDSVTQFGTNTTKTFMKFALSPEGIFLGLELALEFTGEAEKWRNELKKGNMQYAVYLALVSFGGCIIDPEFWLAFISGFKVMTPGQLMNGFITAICFANPLLILGETLVNLIGYKFKFMSICTGYF